MNDELYYTDLTVPDRICTFFEKHLRHAKGALAGKPFTLLDWQKDIIQDVYGTYRKDDGRRRYRTIYIEVPRKNGKSSFLAGLCLYALFEEAGAEVYIVASSREQAGILFGIASSMVLASPSLKKILKIYRHSIHYTKTNSTFKVLSRDAHSALGTNPSMACMDELLTQPDDGLYSSLKTGMAARENPLMFCITTAADSKSSFCYRLHEYTEAVNNGDVTDDDSFYGRIWGLKEGEDWEDEDVWFKCNPSLGHSISLESFRTDFKQARSMAGMAYTFKSRNLNAWISTDKTWIKRELWEACADENLTIDDFAGEDCYAGLDLSSVTDLTALVLCFPRDGKYYFFPYIFCPEDNIEKRSKVDKVPYRQWADEGHMFPTSGNRVDQQHVLDKVAELHGIYNIRELAIDRWNAAMLTTKLQEIGCEVVSFGQGFASMSEPSKSLERLVLGKEAIHPNNSVYNWTVDNVILETDAAGNYKPNKKKSKDRIDPVVATVMALGRAELATGPVDVSNVSWV